jgi:hypothetical protein
MNANYTSQIVEIEKANNLTAFATLKELRAKEILI